MGTKSARTRSTIIGAALELFRERGYDDTTMRAIAAKAGVSVGNAYYYFASKDELIQAFYDQAQVEHANAAAEVLASTSDLTERIVGVVDVWIDAMEPYRAFAGTFFKNAAEPTSPLSPFSPESSPARAAAIALWRDVLEGSEARVPKRIRADLPELLWLYFMGLVLLWVHDQSEEAATTRRIVRRTAPLVVRALSLVRLPVMRGMIEDIAALMDELKVAFGESGVSAHQPGAPLEEPRRQRKSAPTMTSAEP